MSEPRISALTDQQTSAATREFLQQTQQALGMVPNLYRALAHAPAALRAYTSAVRALASGKLTPQLREQIAVATAAKNGCAYCASAHTALGKGVGIDPAELSENLCARSSDPKVGAALEFVTALIERHGDVADAQLAAVRAAGFDEQEIVEIVAHVGVNNFTNMFNVLARTEVDFPRVDLTAAR